MHSLDQRRQTNSVRVAETAEIAAESHGADDLCKKVVTTPKQRGSPLPTIRTVIIVTRSHCSKRHVRNCWQRSCSLHPAHACQHSYNCSTALQTSALDAGGCNAGSPKDATQSFCRKKVAPLMQARLASRDLCVLPDSFIAAGDPIGDRRRRGEVGK